MVKSGFTSLCLLNCIVVPFGVFGLRVISHVDEIELRFASLRRVFGGFPYCRSCLGDS